MATLRLRDFAAGAVIAAVFGFVIALTIPSTQLVTAEIALVR
jgi:uncharacterized membrane protein YccC